MGMSEEVEEDYLVAESERKRRVKKVDQIEEDEDERGVRRWAESIDNIEVAGGRM